MLQRCQVFGLVSGILLLVLADDLSISSADELAKTRARLAAGDPTTIVCLGDSVTGVYYHTGGRRAYTDMVGLAIQKAIPQAKVTMINAGISGHSTVNGLERFDRDVAAKKPHLVTVMFGLNDMVRIPISDYQSNLKTLILNAQNAGAEVLLCTPNGVINSAGRPAAKLAEYSAAIHSVADDIGVPVADCHEAFGKLHTKDAQAWRLLFSDAFHPNMDGHKFMAVEIAEAITGKRVSLDDVNAPADPLRHTRTKVAAGQPLNIVAMTPYDELLKTAFATVAPRSSLKITPWPAAGKSFAEIAEFGKQVRGLKPDLVWVAIPSSTTAQAGGPSAEAAIAGYSGILNSSLSFGVQDWDVVAASPLFNTPSPNGGDLVQANFARRLIRAQDLTIVDRTENDLATTSAILSAWLRGELEAKPNGAK